MYNCFIKLNNKNNHKVYNKVIKKLRILLKNIKEKNTN